MRKIALIVAATMFGALAACGAVEPADVSTSEAASYLIQSNSGGVCTGRSDVCHPETCSYDFGTQTLSCQHSSEQDSECDALCRDRGGGRCSGDGIDPQVTACVNACKNAPIPLLCLGQCETKMVGYCTPNLEP